MKKLILLLMSFTIVLTSYSQTNPFKKNKERAANRALEMKKNSSVSFPTFSKSSSNVNVAQLLKESWWDEASNAWSPSTAMRSTYTNDRLVSVVQTSYDGVDTFGAFYYNYDANGRYSLVEYKMFNGATHQFENYARQTLTYSANGSNITLFEIYNSATNSWGPTNRLTTVYDNRYNLIGYKYENYDGGLWITNMAYSSNVTYLGNTKKIILEIDSNFIDTAGIMAAEFKTEKTYDINGKAIKIINSGYDNGVEEIQEIDSLIYNSNGIPTTLLAYSPMLDPIAKIDSLNWNGKFNNDIDLFQNEPDGYVVSMYDSGNWMITNRYTTNYPDNNGSRIHLEENYDINHYVPASKYNFIYDFNKNMIESSDEFYDSGTNTWSIQNGNKNQYTYDINQNILENIYSGYNFTDSVYINNFRQEFSDYISIVAGLNNIKSIETKIFPNPSINGKVNIDLNLEKSSSISIEVVDINGRLVNVQHEDLGQGLNTVELNGLNKGLYFVIITSDFGVSRTKLIVK